MKTDAAGRIEISYTADDPDASDDSKGDQITLTLTLTALTTDDGVPTLDLSTSSLTSTATDADYGESPGGIQAIWTDADAVASHLSLSQSGQLPRDQRRRCA